MLRIVVEYSRELQKDISDIDEAWRAEAHTSGRGVFIQHLIQVPRAHEYMNWDASPAWEQPIIWTIGVVNLHALKEHRMTLESAGPHTVSCGSVPRKCTRLLPETVAQKWINHARVGCNRSISLRFWPAKFHHSRVCPSFLEYYLD